jgi:3-oxoacyl-[acyl-carrier protein] reductase
MSEQGRGLDLGLDGRKAIVCASSKGLGRACATALAEAGVHVTINGRDRDTLEATARDIRERTGAAVTAVVADVSTPEGQAALLEACPAPDILVNNNGGPPYRDFRELDRAAIMHGVEQCMVTPIELIRAVIDGMVQRRFGRIVNITSAAVYAPVPGLDLSSGARAGLTAFLAGVARTVAASNVTINQVLPGIFATDRMVESMNVSASTQNRSIDEVRQQRLGAIPARRFGDPAEFGRVCAFLCSTHASYIVGQNIVVDGGAYQSSF